jgi:hypothetical protein
VKRRVFLVVEAFPVPDADLFGREPDGGPGRVGFHREAAEDQLKLLPVIAGRLVAEGPEGAAVVLLDLAGDADIGEVGLDDLRRRQALGLVEDVERDEHVADARLGQKLPRAVGVVVVEDRIAVAGKAGRDDAGRGGGGAEIGGVDDGLPVDGVLDRAAHERVVERRRNGVQAHPDIGQRGFFEDDAAFGRVLAQALDRADGRPGMVQIARLEAELGRRRVLDRHDVDFLEAARFAHPVGVADKRRALARHPFGHDVAARLAHGFGRDAAAQILDRAAREDGAGHGGKGGVPERREGFGQADAARKLVDHLDGVERRPVARIGAFHRRIGDAFDRELHVVGGHRAVAVGEGDAGLEPEEDREVVLLRHLLGGIKLPVPAVAGGVGDEAGEDFADDVAFGRRKAEGGVEHLEVAVGPDRQHASVLADRHVGPDEARGAERARALEHAPPAEVERRFRHVTSPCLWSGLGLLPSLPMRFAGPARVVMCRGPVPRHGLRCRCGVCRPRRCLGRAGSRAR